MNHQILSAKYKSVIMKVRPVNDPMPQNITHLRQEILMKHPYHWNHLYFKKSSRSHMKDCKQLIWAHQDVYQMKKSLYSKNVIILRGKAVAFCEEERGLLKASYGKPYKIPEIPYEPLQKKPTPITK
ncbi:hypothetical protein O181_085747 [Austropuccinia psidii MF-1]|uniref:Uncharacterized protein n=1 Tax=Austropuccinia psidii MF-1 TaxID=1389203 RepID=A0A9Q3FYL8_9BASI|nr:hypothetical protein [Austropuccinia psidii MF-1]